MTPPQVHGSLSRQLRRLGLCTQDVPSPAGWVKLLGVVSESYADSDADRYTLERAAQISSDEMRSLHDVLRLRATQDALTGLPNRSALCAVLDSELTVVPARSSDLAVLFIDLDGFKRVNDSLGHGVGDDLLIRVSERIRGTVRAEDVVARLGGDEFVVCTRNNTDPTAVADLAQRIVEQLELPFVIRGEDITIGASVGIAFAQATNSTVDRAVGSEELLARADLAMYEAKSTGRSRFVVFDEQMGRRAADQSSTENALRHALHYDELLLHYQPIVDLRSATATGMETVVRWNRPGHGLVMPDSFIPVAEHSRLITDVDSWVVKRACSEAASWSNHRLGVSVNISARDLLYEEIVDAIEEALRRSGLRPERLTVELTETAAMSDVPVVAANLRRIDALGVGMAIDNFGTGSTSLTYLRRLRTGTLKIDKSLIAPIGVDAAAATIVGAVITIAHAVGQVVVAEGVETHAQVAVLRQVDCDAVQGNLFGRPQAVPVATDQSAAPFSSAA